MFVDILISKFQKTFAESFLNILNRNIYQNKNQIATLPLLKNNS